MLAECWPASLLENGWCLNTPPPFNKAVLWNKKNKIICLISEDVDAYSSGHQSILKLNVVRTPAKVGPGIVSHQQFCNRTAERGGGWGEWGNGWAESFKTPHWSVTLIKVSFVAWKWWIGWLETKFPLVTRIHTYRQNTHRIHTEYTLQTLSVRNKC